ncbi:hypothetical protein F7731_19035 [Cytobacillus depressus]|uniref:Zf-HC2 domain-containing protein n=1 Tax=Cytobacillus depressus TaxID=1602942 RepID=A0A6L3V3D3_9BACI|nr:hypothetical protein [Cytobacillus depressus]KAB2331171.1 hypothetical protein F7731_19035 [Cytobacillus depressus]
MRHYSKEEWTKYVKNELDHDVREDYENHLYTCDQCLDIYIQAVDEVEGALPVIENESAFTDLIMAQIARNEPPARTERKGVKKANKPFYQSAIFHYSIAAAMTILLMSTGVFQSITHYTESVQMPSFQEKRTSVTEGIVDKTFAWIDSLEKKSKEANK